jgi:hypothetical protein
MEDFGEPDGIEISIDQEGKVVINGWAETTEVNSLIRGLEGAITVSSAETGP